MTSRLRVSLNFSIQLSVTNVYLKMGGGGGDRPNADGVGTIRRTERPGAEIPIQVRDFCLLQDVQSFLYAKQTHNRRALSRSYSGRSLSPATHLDLVREYEYVELYIFSYMCSMSPTQANKSFYITMGTNSLCEFLVLSIHTTQQT